MINVTCIAFSELIHLRIREAIVGVLRSALSPIDLGIRGYVVLTVSGKLNTFFMWKQSLRDNTWSLFLQRLK